MRGRSTGLPLLIVIIFLLPKKCILQSKSAYAIMPVGKKKKVSIVDKERNPPVVFALQMRDSSFLLYWQSTQ